MARKRTHSRKQISTPDIVASIASSFAQKHRVDCQFPLSKFVRDNAQRGCVRCVSESYLSRLAPIRRRAIEEAAMRMLEHVIKDKA